MSHQIQIASKWLDEKLFVVLAEIVVLDYQICDKHWTFWIKSQFSTLAFSLKGKKSVTEREDQRDLQIIF